MSDIEITLAAHSDLPRLLEIRHDAFARFAPDSYSAEEVATLLADVDPDELTEMIEKRQLFVVRVDGEVIGLAGWKDDRLRHVYVDPSHVRRGIGTALVRHVEAEFRERTQADEIKAGVGLQAEGFYVELGYELLKRDKASDGSEVLWMVKRL